MFRFINFFLIALLIGVLAGCKSSEERAQEYYKSALSLLEKGDVERALLELRNVFDDNARHREARRLYADLVLEQGNVQEAYGQYLQLVEQYPDALDVRRQLAEIALDLGNWEEVKRHGGAAIEMAPELPAHQALSVFMSYNEAKLGQNEVAAGEAVNDAAALLAKHPDLSTALRIMMDWHASGPSPTRALPYLEKLLVLHPDAYTLYMARLSILQRAGQIEEISTLLQQAYERFPENAGLVDIMIKWYRSQSDYKTLETFLRERAGPDNGPVEGHMAVIALLAQTQGEAAAIQELNRLIVENAGSDRAQRYALQEALLRFKVGAPSEAVSAIERVIEQAEEPNLINEARISLSRMKTATGDLEGARTLVDAVLENDPGNVPGLNARALWHIREDSFSEAITGLRRALDQEPRNANTLLLLAEAQQKMGNVELAEQRLAQAVEVTSAAPRETLIYARFQIARGHLVAADRVLRDSFKATGNMEVGRLLGEVLLRRGDFQGAKDILDSLASSQNPNAAPLARSLQAALLFSQNRIEEGFTFLRNSVDEGDRDSEFSTSLKILRVQMMTGRFDQARSHIVEMREQYPENLALRLMEGNLHALEGFPEKAIKIYHILLEENPGQLLVVQRLYAALREIGRGSEAAQLLSSELERQPNAFELLMLRALELEEELQNEAAIAIYEDLYRQNPENLVLANNLASMLATHRENPDDIKRAYVIAQRLNGSTIPALLDTLGWVQFLNEETDSAILSLQAAARGLPGNPTVAFNLAHAYAQADRIEDARAELVRGFRLAGDDEAVPQFSRARKLLRKLDR